MRFKTLSTLSINRVLLWFAGPKLPLDQEGAHLFVRAFLNHMIHKAGEEFYVVCKAVEGHPAMDGSDKTVIDPSDLQKRPDSGPYLPQKRKSRDEETSRSPGNEGKVCDKKPEQQNHANLSQVSPSISTIYPKDVLTFPLFYRLCPTGELLRATITLPLTHQDLKH